MGAGMEYVSYLPWATFGLHTLALRGGCTMPGALQVGANVGASVGASASVACHRQERALAFVLTLTTSSLQRVP